MTRGTKPELCTWISSNLGSWSLLSINSLVANYLLVVRQCNRGTLTRLLRHWDPNFPNRKSSNKKPICLGKGILLYHFVNDMVFETRITGACVLMLS
jgi:hypothetical protein